MKLRFPLYTKILFWFFLNMLFLGAVFYGFLRVQFRVGLDSLLWGQAGERVQSVSQLITGDLNTKPRTEWNDIMKRFSSAYKMQFYLFRNNDGSQAAGENIELPSEVQTKLAERRGPPFGFNRPPGGNETGRDGFRPEGGPREPPREGTQRGPARSEFPGEPPPPRENTRRDGSQPEAPPREGFGRDGFNRGGFNREGGKEFRGEFQGEFRQARPPGANIPTGPNAKEIVHTSDPSRYWVLVRIPVFDRERQRPSPVTLMMVTDSIRAGGYFFDFVPWISVGIGVVLLSALFWLPLVRGITRSVSQMTQATELVAEGKFDTRVDDQRRDELGRLGSAINRMAARLSGFVMGQKRFLGDIAHELCSPIARTQAALGVLEMRANESQKPYVDDVREEVQHMSSLVNELLSFSKAGLKPQEVKVVPVDVGDIAQRAADREAGESAQIQVQVPGALQAMADPELLMRAISNLIRNAIRYAGHAGPITVSALAKDDRVIIMVADSGPGVPEAMLQQIFDPFFRVESSRSRDTGGVGLGLAIVKTCVESCRGSVSVKNLSPSGLQVEITLQQPAKDAAAKAVSAVPQP